jgi:uncharacterized protein (DUF433 family)
MGTAAEKNLINPQIGEGIFLIKDVSKILQLPYEKVYRWIVGYWGRSLSDEVNYVFGNDDNRAINFYSLIEFYTFFKLREKGVSTQDIRILHKQLSVDLNTPYPFAIAQDYFVDKKHKEQKKKTFVYYKYLDSLIRLDKRKQFSFDFIINDFLDKIEFDESNFARRYVPIGKDRNVVVDPKKQFGQPTILGRNIKTQTVYSLHRGGETNEDISTLYNLTIKDVEDAIYFHNQAA